MKKHTYILLLVALLFSCSKHSQDNKDGITVYLSVPDMTTIKNVSLKVNGKKVYDDEMKYGSISDIPFRKEVKTKIKANDSTGYYFEVSFNGRYRSFYIPAKGLESLIIANVRDFEFEVKENTKAEQDTTFTIFISKNITDNCNLKIAINNDTLYNGKFYNNYPTHSYDTLKFIPNIRRSQISSMYFEIEEALEKTSIKLEAIYDFDPDKINVLYINLNSFINVITNLDDNWDACWQIGG